MNTDKTRTHYETLAKQASGEKDVHPKWGHFFQLGDCRFPDDGPAWEKTVAFRVACLANAEERELICGNCASEGDFGDPLTIAGSHRCHRCDHYFGSPSSHEAALARTGASA